jgi:hypothetical protein
MRGLALAQTNCRILPTTALRCLPALDSLRKNYCFLFFKTVRFAVMTPGFPAGLLSFSLNSIDLR